MRSSPVHRAEHGLLMCRRKGESIQLIAVRLRCSGWPSAGRTYEAMLLSNEICKKQIIASSLAPVLSGLSR